MPAAHLTYVYGVRRPTTKRISTTGIGGAQLQEIEGDGVAALVSDLPDDKLELGREELTTHARVLEQALEAGTVLPMRFGVVMENHTAVQGDLLEAHRDELRQQLEQFHDKVELRLRAIYDEQQLMREIVAEHQEIARLRAQVAKAPQDATYYERIRLGELVAGAIDEKREADTPAILHRLEPLAHATELGSVTHERMVLSASFLVDRERLAEFDMAVDRVGREQHQRMRLKYTGPLAPYSFAELRGAAAPTAAGEGM